MEYLRAPYHIKLAILEYGLDMATTSKPLHSQNKELNFHHVQETELS